MNALISIQKLIAAREEDYPGKEYQTETRKRDQTEECLGW